MKKAHYPSKSILTDLLLALFLCTIAMVPAAADGCSWGAPLNVRDSLRGATSMIINWDTPVQGAPPGGYQVTVGAINIIGNMNQTETPITSIKLEDLTPGTHYQIEIKSICENGETGPASLIGFPTIIVELVANGELFDCQEPYKKPAAAASDFYSPNVPYCNNQTNPGCAGITDTIEMLGTTETEIYSILVFKDGLANKNYWGVIERSYNDQNFLHYKIKRKDNSSGVSISLESGQYLYVMINNIPFARIDFFANQYSFTKLYNSPPNLVAIADKFSECGLESNLIGSNNIKIDTIIFDYPIVVNFYKTEKITCFPNPAVEYLNFSFQVNKLESVYISIIDINGIEVIKSPFNGYIESQIAFGSINIKNLETGIYYLFIENGDNKYFTSFIK